MSDQKKEPTAAEAMLFFSIVKNTRNKADVDWDAVATEQGFKNSEVAKVCKSTLLLFFSLPLVYKTHGHGSHISFIGPFWPGQAQAGHLQ